MLAALGLGLCSMALTPPDEAYLDYFDFRVLGLLFCLMSVVKGAEGLGLFERLSHGLLTRAKSMRAVTLVLVLLPFFSSMLVTNDVALLAFVPFAIAVIGAAAPERLIFTVVLQTVAANLGSALTPLGNPQNLYLASRYGLNTGDFIRYMGPVVLLSLVLLFVCGAAGKNVSLGVALGQSPVWGKNAVPQARRLLPWLYAGLFLLCLLAVLRVLHWLAVLGAVVICQLIFDRKTLLRVDYGLLLTFVGFFVFVGNLGRVPAVRGALSSVLAGREMLVSAAASQVISNVPAALMLSGFTENGPALLLGVNIGGLGTPIASMASIISLRLYAKSPGADQKKFLLCFTLWNFAILAVLLAFAWLWENN